MHLFSDASATAAAVVQMRAAMQSLLLSLLPTRHF
jgi:hypothetical protein